MVNIADVFEVIRFSFYICYKFQRWNSIIKEQNMKLIYKCIMLLTASFCLAFVLSSSRPADATQTAPKGMLLIDKEGHYPYYISITEETNLQWKTYTDWLKAEFVSYPEVYQNALPKDTMSGLWLQYNDPFLNNKNSHAAYLNYPVTGVSWQQVNNYLEWKTNRLNEAILNDLDLIDIKMSSIIDENNFNTEAYLNGQYDPFNTKKMKQYLNNKKHLENQRNIDVMDGMLYPQYRLPSEEEWLLAESCVADPFNENLIKEAMGKKDFLTFWIKHYNPNLQIQQSKYNSARYATSNFKGGAMEWLIEKENSKSKVLSEFELLINNGWQSFDASSPFDQYGSLKEKDSLGRLPFKFVQIATGFQPLYLTPPFEMAYIFKDTSFINPFYGMDHSSINLLLKTRFDSLYNEFQKFYINDQVYVNSNISFPSFLYSMRLIQNPFHRDSIFHLSLPILAVDHRLDKRKYIASCYKDTSYKTAYWPQSKSQPLMGFRSVLPYTGLAVIRKYKVKW